MLGSSGKALAGLSEGAWGQKELEKATPNIRFLSIRVRASDVRIGASILADNIQSEITLASP